MKFGEDRRAVEFFPGRTGVDFQEVPLVSVGLVIKNGGQFIEETIESLLAQKYSNIEIFISDNNSSDNSEELCRRFAEKDDRIKYLRNSKDIGPSGNFNQVANFASGKYFFWASDHDKWHPEFVYRLVAELEQNPKVVLCYPQTVLIDRNGQNISSFSDSIDTRELSQTEGFLRLVKELDSCNMFYGIFRTEVLHRTEGAQVVFGADHVMLAEISLHGPIAQVKEPLFYRRENHFQEDFATATERRVSNLKINWSDQKLFLPWISMVFQHFQIIANSRLSQSDKSSLVAETRKIFRERFREFFTKEIDEFVKSSFEALNQEKEENIDLNFFSAQVARLLGMAQAVFPDNSDLQLLERYLVWLRDPKDLLTSDFWRRSFEKLGMKWEIDLLYQSLPEENPSQKDFSSFDVIQNIHGLNELTVSVVIPTYNRAKLLPRAMASILNQTRPVQEIVVVDDGSTDNTVEVLRELQKRDSVIRYIQIPNSGAQAARNAGIRAASGAWIAFLDSDDEFLPEKIQKQLAVAQRDGVPVVHCECYVQNGDNPDRKAYGTRPISGNIYPHVLAASHPGPTFPGLLVRKEALEAIGWLDEKVPSWQEWDTVIRLARQFPFGYVPDPLFVYHQHGGEAISRSMARDADGYSYIISKHWEEILNVLGAETLQKHLTWVEKRYRDAGLQEQADACRTKRLNLSASSAHEQVVSKLASPVSAGLESPTVDTGARIQELLQRAEQAIAENKYVGALSALDELARLAGNPPDLHFTRAQCLAELGFRDRAISAARAELSAYPANEDCAKWLSQFVSSQ